MFLFFFQKITFPVCSYGQEPDTTLFINIITNDSVTAWDCNGVAAVQATGGTEPYLFIWSNGETAQVNSDLCPGNYCITVTDAHGHSTDTCFELVEFIDTSCSASYSWLPAGSISCYETCYEFIDNSTGQDYELMWSFGDSVFATSANPVFSFTEYGEQVVCLTITTNTCRDSICQTIIVSPCQLWVDTIIEPISYYSACDGSIQLDILNGTQPYSIIWNNGNILQTISGLCEDTYCVTVTDAFACKDSICAELTNPPDTSCHAEFNYIRQGIADFLFHGFDANGDITGWFWDFGDNNFSTVQHPVHSFPSLGFYNVCLAITNVTGCQDTICKIIHIDSCNISLSANIQNISCYGYCDGQVMLIPSDGAPPYIYTWQQEGNNTAQNVFLDLCSGAYQVTVTDADFCSFDTIIPVTEPDTLVINSLNIQITCFNLCDGIIDYSVSGGTSPYSYYMIDWGTYVPEPVGNLCPGEYIVKITDQHGCTTLHSSVINNSPPQLLISDIEFTDVSCFLGCDGSAMAFVTGGTPGYSYMWNNGMTTAYNDNLCHGVYFLTITDANGCDTTGSVIISQPGPINISLTKTDAACYNNCNGSITGSALGSTFPYSFEWSNGMTGTTIAGLCDSTYYTTVTDGNQCTGTAFTTIEEPDTLIVHTLNIINPTCNNTCNGSAQVSILGGTSPYSVLWSNGASLEIINNLCGGNYSATITDNHSCTAITNITLNQPQGISLNITVTAVSGFGQCDGAALVIPQGGHHPYQYLWSNGNTDSIAVNLCEGTWCVTVTDNNGCTLTDSALIVSPPTYKITGRVYAGTNLLPQGIVLLYTKESNDQYFAKQYSYIDNGQYLFEYLNPGTYLLYAVPYIDIFPQTPIYMPTYYGNKVFWSQAHDIEIVDNISGADIFLAKNESIVYGFDWFEILGNFYIPNVPYQSYKVYPEKAGFLSHPVYITMNDTIEQANDINFRIIYKEIISVSGSVQGIKQYNHLHIYPNPFHELINIDVELIKNSDFEVNIYNCLGSLIYSHCNNYSQGNHIIPVDLFNMSPGIYFIQVRFEDGTNFYSKIIK
ncbi:MAG: T9SS type A sorting domain-containing protein, partial [Bacteroidia bacterium]|nr:T9SS type A sorting domain-containing protein [Bacteroidia bacterium]